MSDEVAPWESASSDAAEVAPWDSPAPTQASSAPAPSASPNPASDTDYSPTTYTTAFGQKWQMPKNVENTLAGAGKWMSDQAQGIHQIALHIGNHLGLIPNADVQSNQDDIDAAAERDKNLMDTKAGMAGNIGAQALGAFLLPQAGIAGSAAEMGALGATQPVTTPGKGLGPSRLQNAGMGALGGAAGATIGKVVGALSGFGVPMERQAAVDILDSEGIPTTVAQKTGSKAAQNIERASAMMSDQQRDFIEAQAPKLNAAVLKWTGIQSGDEGLTGSEVLSALGPNKTRIGNGLDAIAARSNINVDNQFLNDMGQVEHDAMRQLPASDIGPLRQNVSDILENAAQNNGQLTGTFYQKIRSNLGALAQRPETAPLAGDLQDAVDNALHRSVPQSDIDELASLRQQYRALKQIEPAVDKKTGNIGVSPLVNSLSQKSNRNQWLYGKGDQGLVDLARAANTIIPDTLGNSGTPERMLLPLTVMEAVKEGSLPKAAVKGAAAIYGGGLAGRAMRNQGMIGSVAASGVPGVRAVTPTLKSVSAPLGYGVAEAQPRDDDNQIERARGGKVDMEALVTRLINRWKAAKKQTDATTKPLLKVPDATIVKALDLAGRAI